MNKKCLLLFVALAIFFVFTAVMAQEEEGWEVSYSDNFSNQDYDVTGWKSFLLAGPPTADYIFPGPRRMIVRMPSTDAYLYMENTNTYAEDSYVETSFINKFSKGLSYAVRCRITDQGWYEFRANLTGDLMGTYSFYRYDQSLKDAGKNPYMTLHPHPGVNEYATVDFDQALNAVNTIGMSCEGNTLRFFINGVEQIPMEKNTITDDYWYEGNAGFGIINTNTNAEVEVTNFQISVRP